MPNLRLLNLRGNKLTNLPESLFLLSQLRVLDLSCNKLSELHVKISQLKQLKVLNLAENLLSSIPNSIGHLSSLESLTSEYFIYLPDMRLRRAKTQHNKTPSAEELIALDWVGIFQRRMTLTKVGHDYRLERL